MNSTEQNLNDTTTKTEQQSAKSECKNIGKQRSGIVYKVTCLINDKVYIGITAKSLETRKRQHIVWSRHKTRKYVFHKALVKYGIENFSFDIIDTFENNEDACAKEKSYILEYNSHIPAGYNMTLGGEGVLGHSHKHRTETKLKISNTMKGILKSEETKKNMCAAQAKIHPYMKFDDARAFVRALKLQSGREWIRYCKSDSRHMNIPTVPSVTYKTKGWISIYDWLGTVRYTSYKKEKKITIQFGISGKEDWNLKYKQLEEFFVKHRIPQNLEMIYRTSGWVSWERFLNIPRYKSIEEARIVIHTLGIKNVKEWETFIKANKIPVGIPKFPYDIYKTKGWKSWGDWLGNTSICKKKFIPYNEFVILIRNNGITSKRAYNRFRNNEKDSIQYIIPCDPDSTYKEEWRGWRMALGTIK